MALRAGGRDNRAATQRQCLAPGGIGAFGNLNSVQKRITKFRGAQAEQFGHIGHGFIFRGNALARIVSPARGLPIEAIHGLPRIVKADQLAEHVSMTSIVGPTSADVSVCLGLLTAALLHEQD